MVDALVQQARAHLIPYCLRSSSRLFRSEVAHAFTHDLFVPDLESHIDLSINVVFHRIFMLYLPYFSRHFGA